MRSRSPFRSSLCESLQIAENFRSRIELLEGLRNRKELLKGRCASCRWLPMCNGNFRARAEAATGDYWQSDPGCYLLDTEIAAEVAV